MIEQAPAEDALRWYRDTLAVFAEHQVSWSLWSYKDTAFGLVDNAGDLRNPDLLAMLRG